MAQKVKNSPAIWETWVQSLGWEDPLEEGMATHYSLLAWRIPWTEEPGGLQAMRLQRDTTERLSTTQQHSTAYSVQHSPEVSRGTLYRSNYLQIPQTLSLCDFLPSGTVLYEL